MQPLRGSLTRRVSGRGVAIPAWYSSSEMKDSFFIRSRTVFRRSCDASGFFTGSYSVGLLVMPAMVAASR